MKAALTRQLFTFLAVILIQVVNKEEMLVQFPQSFTINQKIYYKLGSFT